MESHAHNPFWDMVDAVLVINLDQRRDRWKQFQNDVGGIVPREKLHRVSAVWGQDVPGYGKRPWFRGRKRDATWAGRAGCTLSHRRALLLAQDAGWQTILILEDDARFERSFVEMGRVLHHALEQHKNEWGVCYLGFTDPHKPFRRLKKLGFDYDLMQIYGAKTTHAYLVQQDARKWLIDNLPEETQIWEWLSVHRIIDRWYARTLSRHMSVVCVTPSIVHQRAGVSDITGRTMDYQNSHQTAIPLHQLSSAVFRQRFLVQQMYRRCEALCDLPRGIIKRLCGF